MLNPQFPRLVLPGTPAAPGSSAGPSTVPDPKLAARPSTPPLPPSGLTELDGTSDMEHDEVTDDYLEHAVRLVTASAAAAAKAHHSAQQSEPPSSDPTCASHSLPVSKAEDQHHHTPLDSSSSSSSLSTQQQPNTHSNNPPSNPNPNSNPNPSCPALASPSVRREDPLSLFHSNRTQPSHSLYYPPSAPSGSSLASLPRRVQSATPRQSSLTASKPWRPPLSSSTPVEPRPWRSTGSVSGSSFMPTLPTVHTILPPPTPQPPLTSAPAKRSASPISETDSNPPKRRNSRSDRSSSRRGMKDGDPTPWQCTQCSRRYSRAEYMRRHMRSHEKLKPWMCVCNKSFGRSDVYTRHRRQCRKAQLEDGDAKSKIGSLGALASSSCPTPATVQGHRTSEPASSPHGVHLSVAPAKDGITTPSPPYSGTDRAGSDPSTYSHIPPTTSQPFMFSPAYSGTEHDSPAPLAEWDVHRGASLEHSHDYERTSFEDHASTNDSSHLTESPGSLATPPDTQPNLVEFGAEEMRFELLSGELPSTTQEENDVLESLRKLLEGHDSPTPGYDQGSEHDSVNQSERNDDEHLHDTSVFPAQSSEYPDMAMLAAQAIEHTDHQRAAPQRSPTTTGRDQLQGHHEPVEHQLGNLPFLLDFAAAEGTHGSAVHPVTVARQDDTVLEQDVVDEAHEAAIDAKQSRVRSSANAFSAYRQARPVLQQSVLRGSAAASGASELNLQLSLPPDQGARLNSVQQEPPRSPRHDETSEQREGEAEIIPFLDYDSEAQPTSSLEEEKRPANGSIGQGNKLTQFR